MVRINQSGVDSEPTPEFNAQCTAIFKKWEVGNLPFHDVLIQLQALQKKASSSGHLANQARIEHLAGYIQHYRGNLNTSIRHYENARKFYAEVGNNGRVANIDLNQGENYRFKGDFNRAGTLYHRAYEAAAELGNIVLQTIAIINEGLTYLAMGHLDDAEHAFNDGFYLTEQWTDNLQKRAEILCEAHYGMAEICLQREQYQNAWDEALSALISAQEVNQPLQLGIANRTIGEVVTHLDELPNPNFSPNPDDYFRTSSRHFQDINAEAELARTMLAHAKSLAHRGRKRSAARKLQQVMIIFTKLGMVDDAARTAETQLRVV